MCRIRTETPLLVLSSLSNVEKYKSWSKVYKVFFEDIVYPILFPSHLTRRRETNTNIN